MSFEDGWKYYKEADYQKAAEIFYRIVENDEDNAKVWNLLGICLTKLGQYDPADTCFQNSISLEPDNLTYKKNKSISEKKKKNHASIQIPATLPRDFKRTHKEPIPRKQGFGAKNAIIIGFLVFFMMYLLLGITGSYTIGSSDEFFSYLGTIGGVIQEKIGNSLSGMSIIPLGEKSQKEDSCNPYYTNHVIPMQIPNDSQDIAFLDITRNEGILTFKNKQTVVFQNGPFECIELQDGNSDRYTYSRTDMNINSHPEGTYVIIPDNSPEIDWISIAGDAITMRFTDSTWYGRRPVLHTGINSSLSPFITSEPVNPPIVAVK